MNTNEITNVDIREEYKIRTSKKFPTPTIPKSELVKLFPLILNLDHLLQYKLDLSNIERPY